MDMVKDAYFPEHCSLSEALDILLREFADYAAKIEKKRPEDAVGLILAGDIVSRRNVPHYAASAVDGYAVASRDTAGASAAAPATIDKGHFEWVNTGMPVQGSDAVIMVEDTSEENSGEARRIKAFRGLVQGENVRAVGEDVMNGALLACRGDKVTPALASLMLCAGISEISVFAKPRAIFMPTGNEIISSEEWLSGKHVDAGLVVDSNSLYARTLFGEWGFSLDVTPILPDEPEALAEALKEAVGRYDLVLLSAGSAKGKRDHSAEIFQRMGKMLFRYVRMKPGRPAMAAVIDGKPVICSPGFPMSCAVTLWSLVFPLLKALSKEKAEADYGFNVPNAIGSIGDIDAELSVNHSSPAGVLEWLRMKCALVDGRVLAWPLSAGASVLWALADSDGIAVLPESALEMPKGSGVTIHMTRRVDFARRILFQGSDDPAFTLLISCMKRAGAELVIKAVGSMGGLAALGRNEAHISAAHLLDESDGTYNTSYIERFSCGRKWGRTLLYKREQGIITAKGNPKGIKSFQDLASGKLVFENRQPGAGTRVLLDYMLRENGLSSTDIPGYDRISITHLEAANKVASGLADATLGIRAAADALSLDFIPIAFEPFELVWSENFSGHPASAVFFELIKSGEWRSAVRKMGGYRLPEDAGS